MMGPVTAYTEYFAPDFKIKNLMPKYSKKHFEKAAQAKAKAIAGAHCNKSCGGGKFQGSFDYNPSVEYGSTGISLGYNPQHLRLLDRHCGCSLPEMATSNGGKKRYQPVASNGTVDYMLQQLWLDIVLLPASQLKIHTWQEFNSNLLLGISQVESLIATYAIHI